VRNAAGPVLGLWPAAAVTQGILSGDLIEGSVVVEGDIRDSTVNLGDVTGLSPDQMIGLLRLVASPYPADRDEAIRLIGLLLPENARLQAGAVAGFFAILGERNMPPERLQDLLAEIGGH
jgi:hypothetical protein